MLSPPRLVDMGRTGNSNVVIIFGVGKKKYGQNGHGLGFGDDAVV
jgi:hypothetical protein